jgi:hypothetical protein
VHEGLTIAVRTLYAEIAEFRFSYPLITVPEAGPKESLHYYVYTYRNTLAIPKLHATRFEWHCHRMGTNNRSGF